MNQATAFGAWLRERRKALDLTQTELGLRVNCTKAAIARLESGERRPSRQVAELLAAALGIAPADEAAFVQWARTGSSASPTGFPPPATAAPTAPAAPAESPAAALAPPPPTPLIGREEVVRAVAATLRQPDVRLLTLTGAPGIGKTRLALQLATDLRDQFAAGVHFVPLAALRDPALVPGAIAQALGVQEAGATPLSALILDHLRDKHLLLVLDNFEQVAGAAPLLVEWLAACPRLKVLVTSRAALNVRGEQQRAVPPLALPAPKGASKETPAHLPDPAQLAQIAAVALFVERAQAVQPGFRLTADNAPAVAEICVRLDGIPLAIELAAARSKLLAPAAILARLPARLALLAGGPRDLPARQQTLRAAMDWSYELLTPAEQTLFARLGVFAGGCILEAVESVCIAEGDPPGDLLEGLASLLDKSLLRQTATADEPRYTMLETIREYARERLAASAVADGIYRRHAAHYLALAEAAEPHLVGTDQARRLAQLDAEHDNLRGALTGMLNRGEIAGALRLGAALWRFWWVRGHLSEGRRGLESALARNRTLPEAVKALDAAGNLAWMQGDQIHALACYEEGVALARTTGHQRETARILGNLGTAVTMQGAYSRAQALFEESLALARALDDAYLLANAFGKLADLAYFQQDYPRAIGLYRQCLALERARDDRHSSANTLNSLGAASYYSGDYAGALACFEESLALFRALGVTHGIAYGLGNLGDLARRQGDYARAASLYQEALTLFRELDHRQQIAFVIAAVAGMALVQGHTPRAVRLLGAAGAILADLGVHFEPEDQAQYDQNRATGCAQLGEAAFNAAMTAGQDLPLEQVIADTLALLSAPHPPG